MQGPTQRWDQPPDPRESTVSMPRIDPSSRAGQVSEPATAAYEGQAGMALPGFGDPYALPVRAGEPAPARAEISGRSAAWKDGAPAKPPITEPAVHQQPAAPAAPAIDSVPEPEAPPPPVATAPAEPEEFAAPESPGPPGAISRGTTGLPGRRAARRAATGPGGTPKPGSTAELRGRLERLPDGHPSSPYDDAGWLKPSPARLRQLELGLPAQSLGTSAGYAERFGIDPDDDVNHGVRGPAADARRAEAGKPGGELPGTAAPVPPGTETTSAASGPAHEAGQAAASADIRASHAAPPANAPSPATRPAASNGHRDSGDSDGRLRLQHPYAGSGESDQGGNGSGSAELALTRWPARETAADRGSDAGDQQDGHHATADRPAGRQAEPAGSERDPWLADPSHTGVSRRREGTVAARPRLSPELRDLVDRVMAACRAAEGRTARGGYGTSGLTPALRRIATQLPAGGLAPGSEADTLKPADRFATRLMRLIDRQPGRPPAELAATIGDCIRYAFSFPATAYTEGTLLVHRKLKAQGFDLEARRNQWDSREYKGVFTRWRDPAHELAFEVQFHTTDSWAVLKQTHDAYQRITDPATPAAERARLRARQVAAAAMVSSPPGCRDIADFRAETR